MSKAVIFDLDGTLIDSIPDVRLALNTVLESHGNRPLTRDELETLVGEGAMPMIRGAFAMTGDTPDDLQDALRQYLDHYAAHPVRETTLYDGAVAMLEQLRQQGYVLAVCTNKPQRMTDLVLRDLGIAPLFAAAIGGDTLPWRKPDGRHILSTLEQAGGAAKAVMIGDSHNDIQAAKHIGMASVAVSFGYCHDGVETLGADRVIDHFDQLPTTLKDLGL
ncbi:MAG: HAD-IA family hydrolase [Magnetospirillum sp.]